MANSAKPKLLFVTRKFPPAVGGMEKYAAELYESLKDQADIKLIQWGGSVKYLPAVLPYFFVRGCWQLLTDKIDIIHMQDGLLSPMGAVFKLVFRKPLCVVVHGLDVTYKNRLYQVVIRWSLKSADRIICISEAAQAEVVKRGIDKAKTSVIPLGIDDDIFSADHKQARTYLEKHLDISKANKIILSVGRLVERKGVHWFIDNVMPDLVKANQDVLFMISGEGDSKPLVEAAIETNKLQANVRLLGRTSDEVRQNLYNGADLFTMPNIVVEGDMEGFGLVLLEASLCELPVVASSIEGIKDAISNGKNGVLVSTKDSAAFKREISKFLNNPKLARDFGKRSRQYTKSHYDWPLIAQQFLSTYNKLTEVK